MVQKILRSLPPKFHAKVEAIKETKDLDNLRVEELIGNLQTYEANHLPTLKHKGMALVSSKFDSGESDDEIESTSDNEVLEALALFVKKFKKFLNKNKSGLRNNFLINKGQNRNNQVPTIDKPTGKRFSKNSSHWHL